MSKNKNKYKFACLANKCDLKRYRNASNLEREGERERESN